MMAAQANDSEPAPEPDPWDLPEGFVFDEAFIKGGVHEPPARTRDSIARYGGQRTSWRQGSILQPAAGDKSSRRRQPRKRRVRRVLIFLVTLVLVGGVGWFAVNQKTAPPIAGTTANQAGDTNSADPAGTDPAATSAEGDVGGIRPYDASGSCYFDPQTADGMVETLDLDMVDCTEPHNYELVSLQAAAETTDNSYPADAYWKGPVSKACEEELIRYTGKPRSAWPDTLTSTLFRPKLDGWNQGDRNIFCMAASAELLTHTIKN